MLQLFFVIFQGHIGRFKQQQDRNQVEPHHDTKPDVAHRPRRRRRFDRSIERGRQKDELQGKEGRSPLFTAHQIGEVRLGNIVIRVYRRKREEEQSDRNKGRPESREERVHRRLRIPCAWFHPFQILDNRLSRFFIDHIVLTCKQNHQRRRRHDQEHVQIDRKCLHKPLLRRVGHFRRRCRVGARPLPRFIRIKAAFDPPTSPPNQECRQTLDQRQTRF